MDERYGAYFDGAYLRSVDASPDRVNRSEDRPARGRLAVALADAEEALHAETGLRLRPDARLWLYLNLQQMVIAPVEAVAPGRLDDLFDALAPDLHEVLARAASSEPEAELSAYRVCRALSAAWERLAVAGGQFWDREE
jgi:hypothetical protein